MKKSELAIVFFMLAFCGFFYHETLLLPEKAQHYPLFVISLLAVLSVLQLVKMLIGCHGHFSLVSDADVVWKDFLPRQFVTCVHPLFRGNVFHWILSDGYSLYGLYDALFQD